MKKLIFKVYVFNVISIVFFLIILIITKMVAGNYNLAVKDAVAPGIINQDESLLVRKSCMALIEIVELVIYFGLVSSISWFVSVILIFRKFKKMNLEDLK
jgi:hypothetical protein